MCQLVTFSFFLFVRVFDVSYFCCGLMCLSFLARNCGGGAEKRLSFVVRNCGGGVRECVLTCGATR